MNGLTKRCSQPLRAGCVLENKFLLRLRRGGRAWVIGPAMSEHLPDTLRIDVGSVTTRQELHSRLAESFRFPGYYGHNWDAFDECIREIEIPKCLEIVGFETLLNQLPREARLFYECLTEFVTEDHPAVTIRMT